jgi:hypothetical protein
MQEVVHTTTSHANFSGLHKRSKRFLEAQIDNFQILRQGGDHLGGIVGSIPDPQTAAGQCREYLREAVRPGDRGFFRDFEPDGFVVQSLN